MDANGRAVGSLDESDVLVKVHGDPAQFNDTVASAMTDKLETLSPAAKIADLLGVFDQFKPKFTKRYAQMSEIAVEALGRYASEVREGKFPDAEHAYGMKAEEQEALARLLAERANSPR